MQIKVGMQLQSKRTNDIWTVAGHPKVDEWVLTSEEFRLMPVYSTQELETLFQVVSKPAIKFHVGKDYQRPGEETIWRCVDVIETGEVLFVQPGTTNYCSQTISQVQGWIEVIQPQTKPEAKIIYEIGTVFEHKSEPGKNWTVIEYLPKTNQYMVRNGSMTTDRLSPESLDHPTKITNQTHQLN